MPHNGPETIGFESERFRLYSNGVTPNDGTKFWCDRLTSAIFDQGHATSEAVQDRNTLLPWRLIIIIIIVYYANMAAQRDTQ